MNNNNESGNPKSAIFSLAWALVQVFAYLYLWHLVVSNAELGRAIASIWFIGFAIIAILANGISYVVLRKTASVLIRLFLISGFIVGVGIIVWLFFPFV